ncbi:hypothetical protein RCO28_07990 [Streptomyces sp. LHD-70]|uniref:hypothetical protein n=1 Tax=Streptomyces sp. LHD-70 TaxID=3072140 RepID=UPI00280F52C0|nr:hypothetical protein [Streptomyces sp. LHD-70]MDQ8702435.1 hypothetical protein [Streptomyces sp. LHD-70]
MKARRALTAAALTTGLVLTMAGCGDDEADGKKRSSSESTSSSKGQGNEETDEPSEPVQDEVLAEVTGGEGITLTFNSAVRDQGGFLTVSGKVKNGSSGRWIANAWRGEEQELQRNAASMAGATLVDKAGKKRYLILRDTEGRCLCTAFTPFKSGEEKSWYAQFPAPPESTTDITFQIADMPPADIQITEGE